MQAEEAMSLADALACLAQSCRGNTDTTVPTGSNAGLPLLGEANAGTVDSSQITRLWRALVALTRPARSRGLTQLQTTQYKINANVIQQLLLPDPTRRAWTIFTATNPVVVAPLSLNVGTPVGWLLNPVAGQSSTPFTCNEDTHGELVRAGWWLAVGTGGDLLQIALETYVSVQPIQLQAGPVEETIL